MPYASGRARRQSDREPAARRRRGPCGATGHQAERPRCDRLEEAWAKIPTKTDGAPFHSESMPYAKAHRRQSERERQQGAGRLACAPTATPRPKRERVGA